MTLLRSYQQADEATVTRVVLRAPKLTRVTSGWWSAAGPFGGPSPSAFGRRAAGGFRAGPAGQLGGSRGGAAKRICSTPCPHDAYPFAVGFAV